MKASLEFDLPEEDAEYIWATRGHAYWRALSDFREELRSLEKYEQGLDAPTLERVRTAWEDALEGVNLEEIP